MADSASKPKPNGPQGGAKKATPKPPINSGRPKGSNPGPSTNATKPIKAPGSGTKGRSGGAKPPTN